MAWPFLAPLMVARDVLPHCIGAVTSTNSGTPLLMIAPPVPRRRSSSRQAIRCARVTVRNSSRTENAGEAHEVLHCVFVGAAGVPIADVGEPLDLGRHVGEFLEFGGGQQSVRGCDLDRKRIGRRGDVHVAPDKNRTGGYQGWAGQESAEQEV